MKVKNIKIGTRLYVGIGVTCGLIFLIFGIVIFNNVQIQEITAASIEQNSGANQINNAINQLNDVTQRNASTAQDMAENIIKLSDKAAELKELASYFKTKSNFKTKSLSLHNSNKEDNSYNLF